MFFSIERILQAVARHYRIERRLICSRLPSGRAKEAQAVLGRLLYRHGDGIASNWDAVGRVTRAVDPKSCVFGSEPASYRPILDELEQRPELLPEEALPPDEPALPEAAPSARIPEGVSGWRPRGRRNARRNLDQRKAKAAAAPAADPWKHRLETELVGTAMAHRVALAAARMEQALVEGVSLSIYQLREGKQHDIFQDTARFLRAIADNDPWFEKHWRAGRIGAPPRTGKTVIAGQIIAATRMITTFVVPTKTLVRQAEADLRRQLPGVPVGVYYSEEKRLVEYGVNITTYSMISGFYHRHERLPRQIAASSLVFCDEGHRSMTKPRQRVLHDGFHPDAVRIAMTGSEDFNERRQLRHHFSWLIHKITIEEALELEMFAPTRVYLAEVGVSASSVVMVAGDFDQEELGKIMTAVPFFEAVRVFRYHGANRDRQALICCSGRKQALKLQEYLAERRPDGAPEPVVVLADTPNREEIRQAYADGKIDTIINVGVLIEGWNAPRCKLLIDLAPTASIVRATQKYFRPMTVWGEHEAAIYVLLPKDLAAVPVLPMDLFGFERREYEQGVLIASRELRKRDREEPREREVLPRVESVTLASRFLFQGLFTPPELDPDDDKQILEVLLSCPEVTEERVPSYQAFMRTVFEHQLFSGLGQSLLTFLGISVSLKQGKWQYLEFIARYLPEAVYALLADYYREQLNGSDSCEPDRQHLLRELYQPESTASGRVFADSWRGVACGAELCQEEAAGWAFDKRFLWEALDRAFSHLYPRQRRILELRFGLFGEVEHTLEEVGGVFDLNRERIRQIEAQAIRRLRGDDAAQLLWEFHKYGI